MALYTLADLHLSTDVDKPMDIFGGAWRGYQDKLRENLQAVLTEDDTLVIPGDLSWGINLREALGDFRFLTALPGKKILVKGNHDLWWETVSKMERFFADNDIRDILFLHNNYHPYESGDFRVALCGTRGWFFDEEKGDSHDDKMRNREILRLEASLKAAKNAGEERIYCFMHYPPLYPGYECRPILDLLSAYGAERCYYGHLHGESCRFAFQGVKNGVNYQLVSGDSVNFQPILVAP